MSSCTIQLTGTLVVGGSSCSSGCGTTGSNMRVMPIDLACNGKSYEHVVSYDCPTRINTSGAWVALDIAADVLPELVRLKSDMAIDLRVGGEVASITSAGVTYPVTTGSTLTFVVNVDAQTQVSISLVAGTYTAQQIANAINAGAAGVGFSFMPASVVANQVVIAGVLTGSAGVVAIGSGTANAALGFTASATDVGAGDDYLAIKSLLVEYPAAKTGLTQVRGAANALEILLAGKAST